jgi:hypothetical protein
MPETGRALRDTSDELIRDLEALATLEEEKRQIAPDDTRVVDLATRIETIAMRVLVASGRQRELTEQIHRMADEGSPANPTPSIEATPRLISAILADWRDAERRLEGTESGSAEEREVEILVEKLRDEYRVAHEAARRENPP